MNVVMKLAFGDGLFGEGFFHLLSFC